MFVSAGLGDVSPTRQCAAPPWDNRWTAGRSALAPAVPRISQRKRADDLARMCSARETLILHPALFFTPLPVDSLFSRLHR
mmetsp:Transcript_11687/g.35203  ORF Transcript_11687/g.35203 Transcript_11687/m.35203 type:complete len:81 (-) Transcript_11687:26-268(-)